MLRILRALLTASAVLLLAIFACDRVPRVASDAPAGTGGQARAAEEAKAPPAPAGDTALLQPPNPQRRSPRPSTPQRPAPNSIPLQDDKPLEIGSIRLPRGFEISVYAYPVPNCRALSLGPADSQGRATVYAGSRNDGRVYALRDLDGNGRADEILELAKGLKWPVGVAYNRQDRALYVSALSRIVKLPDIERQLHNPPAPVQVSAAFPRDESHGWKFIAFGPDGKLYVPVGAPGNNLDKGAAYANIMRINRDGSGLELVCQGVRNTVGFDWHPVSKELYFTDNGRDWLGDEWPPCELNHLPAAASSETHFGYPYFHGAGQRDPELGAGKSRGDYREPLQELGAHVAPLGMRFYTGSMFPAEYRNAILIAEHGSWNRSKKNGYRISMVRLDEQGRSRGYEIFADGWLQPGERVWGRPVDVLVMPDGSLLISDDHAGAVYRVTYNAR